MFKNIGKKVKTLAAVFCWIGIIASIIYGIVQIIWGFSIPQGRGAMLAITGLLTMALGSLLSWISSFVLYAFGQLVDNSDKLVNSREAAQPAPQYNNYNPYNQQNSYRPYTPQREPVSNVPKQANPVYTEPVNPVYAEPINPVYAEPANPVYAEPANPVYTEQADTVNTEPSKAKCPGCGAELSDSNALFCFSCGTKLK